MNGMITCMYVIEEPGYITGRFISREIHDRIRREAELRLSVLVNDNLDSADKTPFEIIITAGKVHQKIVEKATDLDAAFVVMGRSDPPDMSRKGIGTNANRVIIQTKVPVITVRSNQNTTAEQILLPLDLSKPVGSKLVKTIEVAHMLSAGVSVLSLLESDWINLEIKFRSKLEEIRQFINNEGINCNVHLATIKKNLPDEIISYAINTQAGMIVLMTQQETNFTDFFIGSTARNIFQKSDIPILSIIPDVLLDGYPDKTSLGDLFNPVSLLNI